jgi:hypothetical protein
MADTHGTKCFHKIFEWMLPSFDGNSDAQLHAVEQRPLPTSQQ